MIRSAKGPCRDGRFALLDPTPPGAEGELMVTFLAPQCIELAARGIDEREAGDLRRRLATFADD